MPIKIYETKWKSGAWHNKAYATSLREAYIPARKISKLLDEHLFSVEIYRLEFRESLTGSSAASLICLILNNGLDHYENKLVAKRTRVFNGQAKNGRLKDRPTGR